MYICPLQVLFIELQLPPNGDPNAAPAARSLAQRGRGGPRRGRQKCQFSTSKEVLEKLKKFHPLPGLILEWRRITNALTKVVFPLQKEKVCKIERGEKILNASAQSDLHLCCSLPR